MIPNKFLSFLKNKRVGGVNKNWLIGVVAILTLWGMVLRCQRRDAMPYWVDEVYQLSVMKGSLSEMVKVLPTNEFSSYLSGDYYLIYPFYKIFGEQKWGLTIPHFVATLATFYFLYLVGNLYFKSLWGYVIAFGIVCFNATLIEHSLEVRAYAVLQFFGLACLYFIHRIGENDLPTSRQVKGLIFLFYVFVLLFHSYGMLVIFFTTVYYLGVKVPSGNFKRALGSVTKFLAGPALVALPFLLFNHFSYHINPKMVDFGGVFQFIPNPLEHLAGFLKGIFGNLLGSKMLYFLLLGFPLAILLPTKDRFRQIWFFVTMVAVPILLLLFADIKTGYYFIQRQFIWTMPLFAVLIAWCWESILTAARAVPEKGKA